MDSSGYFLLALLVMLVGLVGTFVPGIPGVPLAWLGLTGFGILDGFQHLHLVNFGLLTLVAIVGTTAGLWGTQLWTRQSGASGCSSLIGSCLLAIGLIFFTLPYAIVLALVGVFGLEWKRRSDAKRAAISSSAWLIGWVFSTLVEFFSALVLVVFFVQSVLSG